MCFTYGVLCLDLPSLKIFSLTVVTVTTGNFPSLFLRDRFIAPFLLVCLYFFFFFVSEQAAGI